MNRHQQKIYKEAFGKLAVRFGRGCIQRTADRYGVSRQMVSATLNGKAHNPTLRRKLKEDFGVECVPFRPSTLLRRRKRKSSSGQTNVVLPKAA